MEVNRQSLSKSNYKSIPSDIQQLHSQLLLVSNYKEVAEVDLKLSN